MLQGVQPNWVGLGYYSLASLLYRLSGALSYFQETAKGFAMSSECSAFAVQDCPNATDL